MVPVVLSGAQMGVTSSKTFLSPDGIWKSASTPPSLSLPSPPEPLFHSFCVSHLCVRGERGVHARTHACRCVRECLPVYLHACLPFPVALLGSVPVHPADTLNRLLELCLSLEPCGVLSAIFNTCSFAVGAGGALAAESACGRRGCHGGYKPTTRPCAHHSEGSRARATHPSAQVCLFSRFLVIKGVGFAKWCVLTPRDKSTCT
jgi:hypothetical protein